MDEAAPDAGAARRDESDGDAAAESVELAERSKGATILGDLEADAEALVEAGVPVEVATSWVPPWAWRARRRALEALGGDPERVLHRMWLDVLLLFASFVGVGVLVFHARGAKRDDRRWRLGYCLYHAINVGFTVGSAPRTAATPEAKVFTMLYCAYGNAVVISALQLLRRGAALRDLGDLAAAETPYRMFLLLTPYFLGALALNMVVARVFAGYDEAVDMIIFAVTNATSCGIFVGEDTEANFIATACALVVSIPTCAAWTGEASHLLFSRYEALEDGSEAAPKTRWSRGRARWFRLLGVDDSAVKRCAADVGLVFLAWAFVGFLFYKYDKKDPWPDAYSAYYAVNIGLNLGSAPRHPTNAPAKLYTVVYSLFGNMLIINSLGLLDHLATVRTIAGGGGEGAAGTRKYGPLATLSVVYFSTLVFAGLVARYAARYDKFLDCALFAVTNSMTCGLLYGKPSRRDWWWTTASVILSVPAAAAWCSELAHLAFLEYENNEAALSSTGADARRERDPEERSHP